MMSSSQIQKLTSMMLVALPAVMAASVSSFNADVDQSAWDPRDRRFETAAADNNECIILCGLDCPESIYDCNIDLWAGQCYCKWVRGSIASELAFDLFSLLSVCRVSPATPGHTRTAVCNLT